MGRGIPFTHQGVFAFWGFKLSDLVHTLAGLLGMLFVFVSKIINCIKNNKKTHFYTICVCLKCLFVCVCVCVCGWVGVIGEGGEQPRGGGCGK